jgi:glutathione S-transferase
MTEDRIAAIRARLEAATPGPWTIWDDPLDIEICNDDYSATHMHAVAKLENISPQVKRNAQFIAQAPEDIAYLLAELDKARETNTRLNRRATKAEAFVGKSVEELRGKGLSFGRALANLAAEHEARRADEAEAKLAAAWDEGREAGQGAVVQANPYRATP